MKQRGLGGKRVMGRGGEGKGERREHGRGQRGGRAGVRGMGRRSRRGREPLRGPAPGRPAPLTSGSRKPQSRAAAPRGSGRCGPIGLVAARRRGAARLGGGRLGSRRGAVSVAGRTGAGGGVGWGRRCCWGHRRSANFLFRPRPEAAETPAPRTWSPRSARAARRALSASRRWRAPSCGAGRGSVQLPDLSSPRSRERRRDIFKALFLLLPACSVPSKFPGARAKNLRALSLTSSALREVLATLTPVSQIRPLSPKSLRPPYPGHRRLSPPV